MKKFKTSRHIFVISIKNIIIGTITNDIKEP